MLRCKPELHRITGLWSRTAFGQGLMNWACSLITTAVRKPFGCSHEKQFSYVGSSETESHDEPYPLP
jgi:hypothetical protein